jgi:hypothetical protein
MELPSAKTAPADTVRAMFVVGFAKRGRWCTVLERGGVGPAIGERIMASKQLSWKWKLTIACVIGAIFFVGFLFSASGHVWMKQKILAEYAALPESEQRDSVWADRYLALAWWAGTIRGDTKEAMDMYTQFCGLGKDKNGNDFTITAKVIGLCSTDGKTGWGPFHPRAPEAHWRYIEHMDLETTASGQFIREECFRFYRLFYTWYMPRNHGKPHENFPIYWAKIRERLARGPCAWPADVDPRAPRAPSAPAAE